MSSAPAVRYPVGRSRFHLLLVTVLGCSGALALSGWMIVQGEPNVRHVVGWLFWLATGLLAVLTWWQTRVGELVFDGCGWIWCCRDQSTSVSIQVELDVQHTLLLRMSLPGHGTCWLWLERSSQPMLWPAARRAVFARQRDLPGGTDVARPA